VLCVLLATQTKHLQRHDSFSGNFLEDLLHESGRCAIPSQHFDLVGSVAC
jgi:hypothetical protein